MSWKRAGCSIFPKSKQGKMRSIVQPGPPSSERIQWVEGRGRAFSLTLEPGLPLLEAARLGFAAQGFAGGTLNMSGGALGPFAYVMPALSRTGENAAFYSDSFRPAGITRLENCGRTDSHLKSMACGESVSGTTQALDPPMSCISPQAQTMRPTGISARSNWSRDTRPYARQP